MKKYRGLCACKGHVSGIIRWMRENDPSIEAKNNAQQAVQTLTVLNEAVGRVLTERRNMAQKLEEEGRTDLAEIFRAHQLLLSDPLLRDELEECVHAGMSAAESVKKAFDHAENVLSRLDNEYVRARSADLEDLKQALLRTLDGKASDQLRTLPSDNLILAATDLLPSDVLRLDRSLVKGVVLQHGSLAGHSAILLRSLGIPTLLSCEEACASWDGRSARLDASDSTLTIDPEAESANPSPDNPAQEPGSPASEISNRNSDTEGAWAPRHTSRAGEYNTLRLYDSSMREISTKYIYKEKSSHNSNEITTRSERFHIYTDLSGLSELSLARESGSDGIGLFRSEFLCAEKSSPPTEDEQFRVYRIVLSSFAPKPVTIRVFDLGSDKPAPFLPVSNEPNPALGIRGIRFLLKNPELFRTQLRALLRASGSGSLQILIPFLTSEGEMRETRHLLEECRQELTLEGIFPAGHIPVGSMVETPAAVLLARELAEESDFFSIGTSDLTQYTLAADRMNLSLEPFKDPERRAVLREIRMAAGEAHLKGIPVTVCGELSKNAAFTGALLDAGADALSVSPDSVSMIRSAANSASESL